MRRRTRNTVTAAASLHRELRDTALALRCAYERFNYVSDPELVEASVYEINSLKARYNYLIRQAKEQGGTAPGPAEPCVAAAATEGDGPCLS